MIKEEKNTELLAIIYSGVIFRGITFKFKKYGNCRDPSLLFQYTPFLFKK